MAKKAVSRSSIQKGYQDYLLTEGKKPETVRILTKYLNTSDQEFYKHFGSLKNIEKSIWEDYFHSTLKVITKDADFSEMDGREKHLSFLFTLMEIVKEDRSYILYKLENKKPNDLPKELRDTRKILLNSDDIDWAKTFDYLPNNVQDKTQTAYKQVLWSHSIATLLFWVKDDSAAASDTDVFIEKTTRTAFDVGENPALESIIDLSKFFLQKMGFSKSTA
ncbi:MAG: hypothetical protein HRT61_17470 [Ekhidna sp.]|nr:hypothetical protein [Ekhidna sp.]